MALDVDVTSFIAKSKASKEALKTATLLKNLSINAVIRGEKGVGKKSLAKYIVPEANIVPARQTQEVFSILEQKNSKIIITDIQELSNLRNVMELANKNNVRVIATSSKTYKNEFLDKYFSINFELPPLKDRPEDVEYLTKIYIEDVKKMFNIEKDVDLKIFKPDLSLNGLSLKKQIIVSIILQDLSENELMQIMYNFLYDKIGGENDYKDFLHLYEAPLIDAGLDKFKSQLQLSQKLGLNRNTLRKKIYENKDYLRSIDE